MWYIIVITLLWYDLETLVQKNHFVYAPSQWETTLQCNVIFHWLGVIGAVSLQAIAWTNAELSIMRSCGIHLRAISQRVLKLLYSIMSLQIICTFKITATSPRDQWVHWWTWVCNCYHWITEDSLVQTCFKSASIYGQTLKQKNQPINSRKCMCAYSALCLLMPWG